MYYAYKDKDYKITKSKHYFECEKVRERIHHFFEVEEPDFAAKALLFRAYLELTRAIKLMEVRRYHEAQGVLRDLLEEMKQKWKNT